MLRLCNSKLTSHTALNFSRISSKRHFSFERYIFNRIYKVENNEIGVIKNEFGYINRIDRKPGYHLYNNSLIDLIFDMYPEYYCHIPKMITLKLHQANAEDINDKLFGIANGVFKFKLCGESDESIAFDSNEYEIKDILSDSTLRCLRMELQTMPMDDYIDGAGEKIKKSFVERVNKKVSVLGYKLVDFQLPLKIEEPRTRPKFHDKYGPDGKIIEWGPITTVSDDRPWWDEEKE